uniref:acetate--CoA ligase n=1 Tax=Poecilia formosa TaxID=48698 RepID=A0A096M6U9_POEFO
VNCLDVHVDSHPDQVALIWERDEPCTEFTHTHGDESDPRCQNRDVISAEAVARWDLTSVSCLAVTAEILSNNKRTTQRTFLRNPWTSGRSVSAQCRAVITCNQGVRGGRVIELKAAAVKTCPSVQHRTEQLAVMGKMDIPQEEKVHTSPKITNTPSPYLTGPHLTSPSCETQAGYLLYTSITHQLVFDYQDGDVFGCMADIGWITGQSYVVYGPLCNGATTVLFDSTPVYPDPGRYWETVQWLQINQFYGAPTALWLLLRHGDDWVRKYDWSSLRMLGLVGEPINHEAWHWFHSVVGEGRCPLVDTWWQTETGRVCIAPRPA